MPLSFKHLWDGVRLVPSSTNTTSVKGDLQVLDSDSNLYYHNGTSVAALLSAISSNTGSGRVQNKELDDSTVLFVDNSDITKKLAFQLSGITTGTTRTLTIPDASTTIVGTDNLQTITNKLLLGAGSGVPDLTLATRDTNFQLHDTFGDQSSFIRFDVNFGANNTSIKYGTTSTFTVGITNNLTLVDTSTIQTIAAKILNNTNTISVVDGNLDIQKTGDATAKLKFSSANITTGTTKTLTAPDANTTIVGTDASQTLTNKTISTANNTVQSGAATAGQVLTADGASGTSWSTISSNLTDNAIIDNVGLLTAVNEAAALNLRATLKDKDGNTPSPASMTTISFYESIGLQEARYRVATHDSSLTVNLPGGAGHTLGLSAGGATVYVYAILDLDNIPGGIHLGFGARNREFGDSGYSVFDIGAGAANSANRVYSDFATSNASFRVIGEIYVNITTPGDWDTIDYITLYPSFNAPYQSITNDMIADVNGSKITSNSITASKITAGTITGTEITSNVNLNGNGVKANSRPVLVSGAATGTSMQVCVADVTSTGGLNFSEGVFTASKDGSNIYTITYSNAFSVNPVPQITVFTGGGGAYVAHVHGSSGTTLTYTIRDTTGTAQAVANFVTVIGTRS